MHYHDGMATRHLSRYCIFCLRGWLKASSQKGKYCHATGAELARGCAVVVERDSSEFARLSQLGDILGLSPIEINSVHSGLAEQAYRSQVQQARLTIRPTCLGHCMSRSCFQSELAERSSICWVWNSANRALSVTEQSILSTRNSSNGLHSIHISVRPHTGAHRPYHDSPAAKAVI